jgi:hypothetical protein
MFSKNEFTEIDRQYFKVINETCYHLTLKSNNTGHTWNIMSRANPIGTSLIVYHKHRDKDPFHEQPNFHPKSVIDAQDMIKHHDIWHLNGRKGRQHGK